jgi:aminomuconate-semialdehyde/2-hydroxymuconate-6-semialdehyde dehydrogenase
MKYIKNYIGGTLEDATSGNWLDNYNPATGEVYSYIPDSDTADVAYAVEAARNAFPAWAGMTAGQRADHLRGVAALIEKNLSQLAVAESVDQGKPVSLALRVDIPRAVSNFKFFASAIEQFSSEAHITGEEAINYTLRLPVGVVGTISPWNLPLYLFTWKIAPALAAGNTVVAKPSEITPMTAFMLSQLCIEAGLPGGVLNIVHGLGPKVGQAMSEHPEIKAISFTGGTKTGRTIAQAAAPMFKKLSLEMGGKNPNIIFADCNWEEMIKTTVHSSFSNQGEICLCGSRIFVERAIYERFKEEFLEKTRSLRVGDPEVEGTRVGAIVSKEHFTKIMSYIDLSKEEGGTILCGGRSLTFEGRCANGWFIEPTVIEGLPHDCRTNQEEIFGPVVTLTPFESEEEVLQYANSTEYGLSATIWTQNLTRAHRISASVQSGIIWVNCWLYRDLRTPFGGMKNSGLGREGGLEALRFFTEAKNVCVKL